MSKLENRTLFMSPSTSFPNDMNSNNNQDPQKDQQKHEILEHRVTQLEELVAKQAVDIKRLQEECRDLTEAAAAFAKVVELLRASGLPSDQLADSEKLTDKTKNGNVLSLDGDDEDSKDVFFMDDDDEIFGKAPSSVMDAADAAGAAILAALLGGQQRMLVDVRDAELTTSAETLVQFIELAILPVAAGLEGLRSKRNRLKIVFPTVKQLLQYRKTMALAAPEVVALSTLNLDPVEPQDNLVVIIAPAPDDEEGCEVMNHLLEHQRHVEVGADGSHKERPAIQQPVVVLNPHMGPIQGHAASFEVVYQMRLLSVQFVSSNKSPGEGFIPSAFNPALAEQKRDCQPEKNSDIDRTGARSNETMQNSNMSNEALEAPACANRSNGNNDINYKPGGITRAMVIRAFPNPWHIFVDVSPNTDADFTIAGTYDCAPTPDEVQISIIECLEGSKREDEIVAEQMQKALETGQLDGLSEMLGTMGLDIFDDVFDEDDEDDENDPWGLFGVDSV